MGTYYPICMFPTNSRRLIGISDAFSAFVYGYPSSCPRAHCPPNKSVNTLRYTRRHGPVYTGHACRHLPSAIPWISEDRLFIPVLPPDLFQLFPAPSLFQLCSRILFLPSYPPPPCPPPPTSSPPSPSMCSVSD